MSLINEALRKARKEAAEAKASPQSPRPPIRPEGRSTAWLPILSVALIAALLGGGISWWILRGDQGRSTSSDRARHVEALQTGPVPADREAVTETAAAELSPDTRPSREKSQKAQASLSTPTVGTPAPSPTESPAPVPPPREAPPALRPTVKPTEPRVFTATATIDGIALSLDYLVFRKKQPFAQINGITVFEGGIVEGFELKQVLEDRIILGRGDKQYTIKVFN